MFIDLKKININFTDVPIQSEPYPYYLQKSYLYSNFPIVFYNYYKINKHNILYLI